MYMGKDPDGRSGPHDAMLRARGKRFCGTPPPKGPNQRRRLVALAAPR